MAEEFIGRKKERQLLKEFLASNESEFLALYGRRRVGKTYLIEKTYAKEIVFAMIGLNKATKEMQLENFTNRMNAYLKKPSQIPTPPKSWLKAFDILQTYLETLPSQKKKVIFIDELPWLATPKSDFLSALENFWNSWASKRKDIVLVVCGSAASWMISNVVRNKGGLHNRITKRIRLMPFNLAETKMYLNSRSVKLGLHDLLHLYMVMGGIPHYLKEAKKGRSAAQIIDEVCFTKDGLLRDEFNNLYGGLFNKPERYIEVIKALAKKPSGLTRSELIKAANLTTGGTTTKIFDSLEESGFIMKYLPFGKNAKQGIFKLSDPYSAFYLKFIANSRATGSGTWIKKSESASWKSWSGFAFERLCLAHVTQLKAALGIQGIYSEESSWRLLGNSKTDGAQVDLLIDRADNIINLCEIKFSKGAFLINKKYADTLQKKIGAFRLSTKTKKSIFLTFISTFGLVENQYSNSLVEQDVLAEVLFREV